MACQRGKPKYQMQMYVSRELVQLKKKRASQKIVGKNQKFVYLKRKI